MGCKMADLVAPIIVEDYGSGAAAPVGMATAPSAGDAREWWMDGVLTVWAMSCRWISSTLQALPRYTWWLAIPVVSLGAFAGAGRGDIGPEETLDDPLIPMVATTKVTVALLEGAVEVPSLHPRPHARVKTQNLLKLGGDDIVCVVSFLKAPPGAFRCSIRETEGGGDGTSGNMWCSYGRSGVACGTSTTAGLGGIEQRGLDGGRVMIDERRMVALYGVVVVSTAGRPCKVDASVQL
ncbi:Katanin p60 ATPase-containing subunit [Hordeum vulgare]|nr:Katanin p60 ATPase-containing subunit [Hordeum vulgare]